MKTYTHLFAGLAFTLAFLLSACGSNPTADISPSATGSVPAITNTPDPCSAENIEAEVQKTHLFMREFDDASALAANRPREQLADSIAELQRIRREAEDQAIPSCLGDLKSYQISHMNSVISTLIAFMNGSDQQIIDQGVALARDQHDKYTLELARLLGLTVEPATVIPLETMTPAP